MTNGCVRGAGAGACSVVPCRQIKRGHAAGRAAAELLDDGVECHGKAQARGADVSTSACVCV